MIDRSSTSSFDAPGQSASTAARRTLRAWRRRLPGGLLWLPVLVLLVHGAGGVFFRQPVASETLRHRTRALTASARPALILGGDSRVQCGLDPTVIADELGLPRPQVANIANSAGDSTRLWCLYREFADQFTERPVILLGVSLFSVNDGAGIVPCDELLWSVSFRERCQIAPAGRALASCFFAERALWRTLTSPDWLGGGDNTRSEDPHRYARLTLKHWSATDRRAAAATMHTEWYQAPRLEGVRWAQLQRNLAALTAAGAQVVLVDPPRHPDLEKWLAPADQATGRQFSRLLAELSTRTRLPLLTCPPNWSGQADADELFGDLVHLNGPGAKLYSRWIAARLGELKAAGLVQLHVDHVMLAAAPTSSVRTDP